jgi:hypothetical protein
MDESDKITSERRSQGREAKFAPITISRTGAGQFTISSEKDAIVLSQADYEDVFFACPLDPPALYLLLNQTILQTAELRDILTQMVNKQGGIVPAMKAIQNAVLALDPKKTAEQPAPAPEPPPAPPVKKEIPTAEVVAPPARSTEPKLVPVAPVAAEVGAAAPEAKAGLHKRKVQPLSVEKAKDIVISRIKDGSYMLGFGNQNVTLSNEKFRELYFALPMDVPSIFKLFFTSLLPDVKSKTVFRRMMSMAGGSSVLLGKIVKELEKLRAQDV